MIRSAAVCMLCVLALSLVPAVSMAQTTESEPEPELYQLDPEPYDPATEPDGDLFIRNWRESEGELTHGALMQYDILFPLDSGDEVHPVERGNVLTVMKRFTYGVIAPGGETGKWATAGEQNIYYVTGGEGTVATDDGEYPLVMDTFVLVPPDTPVSFANTGSDNLTMYIMTEDIPADFTPREDVLVRTIEVTPMYANRGHWTHNTRGRLRSEDGLAQLTGMCPVWYMPGTIGQPHSHPAGVEEVWFVIDGDFHLLMGKQFYNLTPGTAFKIPPTGETPHSNMNFADRPVKVFWAMKGRQGAPATYGKYAKLEQEVYEPETDSHPDMFISSHREHPSSTTHGAIIERNIFTENTAEDPIRPATRGAVLNHLDRFSHGTLMAGQSTFPTAPDGIQEIFYILEGTGTVTTENAAYDLYPGVCFMVPEGLEFTMKASTGGDMTMYIVAEKTPEDFEPRQDLLWRDSADTGVSFTSHWTYDCTELVGDGDGLADLHFVLMVTLPPESFGQPHSHGPGTEEGWIPIDRVEIPVMIGKQIRMLGPDEAYLVPPDGRTFHANINLTDKPVRLFYFGRFE